jgi:hypothetical protein
MTNKIVCFFITDQPKFDRSHETVSVVVGKRALLPCYVSIQDGLEPFKVIIIFT